MKKRIFWRLTMMLAVCFACSLAVPAFAANVQEAQACEQKAAEEYENEDYMYAAVDYEWAAEIYIEIGMPTEANR